MRVAGWSRKLLTEYVSDHICEQVQVVEYRSCFTISEAWLLQQYLTFIRGNVLRFQLQCGRDQAFALHLRVTGLRVSLVRTLDYSVNKAPSKEHLHLSNSFCGTIRS